MDVGCCSLARPNRSAIIGSLLSATVLMLSCGPLSAQQLPTGAPIAPAPADPAIASALQQVSPDNIHAIIEKLVSFNNRSTLSSMRQDLRPGEGVTSPPKG